MIEEAAQHTAVVSRPVFHIDDPQITAQQDDGDHAVGVGPEFLAPRAGRDVQQFPGNEKMRTVHAIAGKPDLLFSGDGKDETVHLDLDLLFLRFRRERKFFSHQIPVKGDGAGAFQFCDDSFPIKFHERFLCRLS